MPVAAYCRSVPLFALILLVSACVTINVYFPAAAAERAADLIIRDVWGEDAGGAPAGTAPQSSITPAWRRTVATTLDWLVPAAHAQNADINISTPGIAALKNAMAARHAQLEPHLDSGAVGLTANGEMAVRDLNLVPLPQRNAVSQLVAQENQDRRRLYREIAVANGQPEWENQIRDTFARRWIDNARPGWYYQRGGTWVRR